MRASARAVTLLVLLAGAVGIDASCTARKCLADVTGAVNVNEGCTVRGLLSLIGSACSSQATQQQAHLTIAATAPCRLLPPPSNTVGVSAPVPSGLLLKKELLLPTGPISKTVTVTVPPTVPHVGISVVGGRKLHATEGTKSVAATQAAQAADATDDAISAATGAAIMGGIGGYLEKGSKGAVAGAVAGGVSTLAAYGAADALSKRNQPSQPQVVVVQQPQPQYVPVQQVYPAGYVPVQQDGAQTVIVTEAGPRQDSGAAKVAGAAGGALGAYASGAGGLAAAGAATGAMLFG